MHESTNRCNGHIQVSPIGKTQKRDRKGCKKGKIEMIMKNSMGATAKAPKLQQQQHLAAAKKTTSTKLFGGGPTTATTNSNHHHQVQHVINSGSVIKNEIIDDPYTFTDSEPQSVGLYSATNCLSSTRKVQSVPSPVSNALARKVQSSPAAASGTTTTTASSQRTADATGKTMRSVATSVDTMIATAKTINQLQADIARNRVAIVKRRKVVPPTPPPPPPPTNPPPPYLQHLLTLTNHQHHQANSLELLPSSTSSSSLSSSSLPSSSSSQRHNPPPPLPPPPAPFPPQRAFARVSLPAKRLARQTTWQRERRSRHELLQRIQEAQQQLHVEKRDLFPLGLELSDSEEDDVDETTGGGGSAEVYQRHWFMGGAGTEAAVTSARGRESRLAQVRSELRRRLRQVWHGVGGGGAEEPPPALVRSVLAAARTQPTATAFVLDPKLVATYSKQSRAKVSMLGVKQCSLCDRRALPCTRHCSQHIMYNVDQLLFAYCTAKLPDHTQCRVPVFDVMRQLPLCPLHATTHVNLPKPQPDTTPKRSRKRTKPSSLNRSRSKKKKKSRSSTSSSETTANFGGVTAVSVSSSTAGSNESSLAAVAAPAMTSLAPIPNVVDASVSSLPVNEMADVFQAAVHSDVPQVEIEVQLDGVEVPEEVLAIASMDPAELASQASKLLEDHDFTNMLLPPDAFNDLFTEDKNGQYEPTKEETEELERALEAVDKDVRSLERTLTSRVGLPLPLAALPPLDTAITLLDEAALAAAAAAAPPPPPPYAVATAAAASAYSNGHHFATSLHTTDLRNS
ncbi:hypothetical protein LSTR_LSTR001278 [Laodelphax striatellus]|uniref:KANL2-like probable zinc-finger domain-containing protein n=1 Tax=Laodelphax striatellus TaxID=195883 RepID=A0A482XC76_LAOST|nr:hypothetical protein LSTR_LSTR001278 [Laodelphax striatellus]